MAISNTLLSSNTARWDKTLHWWLQFGSAVHHCDYFESRHGVVSELFLWKVWWRSLFERKKVKYAELVAKVRERVWQAHTIPVEISVERPRSKVSQNTSVRFSVLKTVPKRSQKASEKASQWPWQVPCWVPIEAML